MKILPDLLARIVSRSDQMILTHQVIDLRGNDIGILKNDVFRESGLTNLQRIFCPHCRIAEIEPRAFRSVGKSAQNGHSF